MATTVETKVSNLRVTGTAAIVGALTAAAVSLTTLTATTATITTATISTANVQTVSGATIKAMNASGIVKATTLSGSTITRSGIGSGVGQAACFKTGGVVGYCSTTPTNGTCTCN